MDPFSLTDGAFSLLGALRATGKVVGKLLVSLKHLPDQIWQLSNELADIEATIARTEEILERLRNQAGNEASVRSLERLLSRAAIPLDKLRAVIQDHIVENFEDLDLNRPEILEFSRRAWLKHQGRVRELQAEIKAVREELNQTLMLISSSAAPQFRSEIYSMSGEIVTALRNVKADNQPQRLLSSTPVEYESSVIVRSQPSLSRNPASDRSSTTLGVVTSIFATEQCRVRLCNCRCHIVSRVQPLTWASVIVGSLFIGYNGVTFPFLKKVECSERKCERKEKGLVKVKYFFPTWIPFASRMVSLLHSWSKLDGSHIQVKFPRVVPASSEIFILAQKGHVEGIRRLFQEGKASVYDISDSEGRSALHFALTANQPETAKFLLSNRADVTIEDKNSLSPIDTLWNYLLGDPSKPAHLAFKEVFSDVLDAAEDLAKRNFSFLHLSIFGLSPFKPEDILQVSTTEIDSKCSLGRTPLCWAAECRTGFENVQTLIQHGASIHLADLRGQTPIHLAAESGCYESLAILLQAASKLDGPKDFRPEVRRKAAETPIEADRSWKEVNQFCRHLLEATDYKGRTALHFAARTNKLKHADLLLRYGANIDHPDSVLSRTPLFIAIYWNHYDMIQLLLNRHARLDMMDDNRMTVLHYAAKFGDSETIRILSLQTIQGVNPHCRDSQGLTPMDMFERVRPHVLSEDTLSAESSKLSFYNLIKNLILVDDSD